MFRKMRRAKNEIPVESAKDLLRKNRRGALAVNGDHGYPYGLPINYWYNEENGCLYFHSGKKGHKIDAISSNDKVSFCVYDEGVKKDGEWALNISSVIIFGKMRIVDDEEKAIEIYRKLSLKFTSDTDYIESEIKKFAKATLCYELQPEHIAGKIVNEG